MTTQSMRFGHFGVNCFDIAKMENFYTQVIGMVVADRGYVPPPGNRHIRCRTLAAAARRKNSDVAQRNG